MIWVAASGTLAGPGTIDAPYDTPQAGYDAAAANYPGKASTVVIAAGGYTSGLVMSSGTVHVLGFSRAEIPSLTVSGTPSGILGKQRVENMVISGPAIVTPSGGGVKFRNTRIEEGAIVDGSSVEFQDCRIEARAGGPALYIGSIPGIAVFEIGVYQSSVENFDPVFGAIEIGVPGAMVEQLEVIGCEIVNLEGMFGPAINDLMPFFGGPYAIFRKQHGVWNH